MPTGIVPRIVAKEIVPTIPDAPDNHQKRPGEGSIVPKEIVPAEMIPPEIVPAEMRGGRARRGE